MGVFNLMCSVSTAYKESANCRLEANYAMQQKVDMIPLMMEKGYAPTGWLGLILGTTLYHPFYSVEADATFTEQMDLLYREIGDRGRAMPESMPPTPAPARTPEPATAAAAAAAAHVSAPAPQQQQ
jgi:hypothetical protein